MKASLAVIGGVETVASFLSMEIALYIQMHDDECDVSTQEMQMTVDYLFKNITKCQGLH